MPRHCSAVAARDMPRDDFEVCASQRPERPQGTVIVSLALPPLLSVTSTVTVTDPDIAGHVNTVCLSLAFAKVPVGALHR